MLPDGDTWASLSLSSSAANSKGGGTEPTSAGSNMPYQAHGIHEGVQGEVTVISYTPAKPALESFCEPASTDFLFLPVEVGWVGHKKQT